MRASWLVWCLYRIYQLNKSRYGCKWDVTIEYLTRVICEKQLTALHVVRIFPLFNRYVFILLTKCGSRPRLFLWLEIFSTFRGVQTLIFTYVSYIVIGLQEEPANFYREKRSVVFVSGHLFTFLMVLSLICLVTTQILVSENQTIWRLKILLRTIVTALLITKCNGRFVKKKKKKKRYQETGKEYFTIVEMIVKEQYLIPDYAKPSPPSTPQTHTHTPTKRTLSAWWSLPIPPPAHTSFFSNSHHDECKSFLITQLPKNKKKKFIP